MAEDFKKLADELVGVENSKDTGETGIPKDPFELAKMVDRVNLDVKNREYTDWAWYVYDNYVKGNHFVKYNEATQTVEAVNSASGSNRFAINKIYSTLRSVRGFITKYDPKWNVFPENIASESIDKAAYKQKLLDNIWYMSELKAKVKQNVFQGLKYSIGILELGWDDEKKETTFTVLDPYDVYFGGPAFPYCNRVTKCVWRTLDDIKNDPKYSNNLGQVSTDEEQYVSNWKNNLQREVYGHQNKAPADDGAIVYEQAYVTHKKNSKGGYINIATFTETSFLRHVETDYQSLWDIYNIYRSDDNPGENYGEGWVKHLIPPQKMIDILESSTMDYHHMFAKGRYIVAKNSGTKIIRNHNGVILEHNAGKRPIIENAPSMAASVSDQIQRLNVYMEDIGGQHDASLGRIPTGASAGIAIEALQEGDANNLKDLVENFDIFLVSLAKNIFKMYARRLKVTKIIATNDKNADGKPDFFAIIGEKARNIPEMITYKGDKIPVCVIREDEQVRVTVDSWLAYTRDAREQRVYKHYTAGMIDRKTALRTLEYTDVDNIISNALKEEVIAKLVDQGPPEVDTNPQVETGEPELQVEEEETAGAISPDAGIPMP